MPGPAKPPSAAHSVDPFGPVEVRHLSEDELRRISSFAEASDGQLAPDHAVRVVLQTANNQVEREIVWGSRPADLPEDELREHNRTGRVSRGIEALSLRFPQIADKHVPQLLQQSAESRGPWVGRLGWEHEPALKILTVTKVRGGEEILEPEEPAYSLYNQLIGPRHYRPFRTSPGEARIAIPGKYGLEVHNPLGKGDELSREFLRRIGYALFTLEGHAVPNRELAVAVGALVARANSRDLPEERVVDLAIRVAPLGPHGSRLNMSDTRRRCLVVRPGSWEIEEVGHPVFDPKRHMLPLPDPIAPSRDEPLDLEPLWRFVNLPPARGPENPRILATALLVQFLICPSSPKPVTVITGEEGAGKTSSATRLGMVVDPSLVPLVRPPVTGHGAVDEDALLNLAMNHAIINIDNVSYISHELSDELARLSTGIGLAKRRLYSDSDEIVTRVKPLVILNGITATPSAADLLRRALFLALQRPETVRGELELDDDWRREHPRILGRLLEIAARAARVLEETPPAGHGSSMADYVRVGQAVSIVLEGSAEPFLAAWSLNEERTNQAAAENPWVVALAEFFGPRRPSEEPVSAEHIARWINDTRREIFPKGVTGQLVGNAIARSRRVLARMKIGVGVRVLHGLRTYCRLETPDGPGSPPIESFARTEGPASVEPADSLSVPPETGPPGPPGPPSEGSSYSERQDSRQDGLSLETPGVDLGGPNGRGPPPGVDLSREVHPGSTQGSTQPRPSEDTPTGGPGGAPAVREATVSSTSSIAGPRSPSVTELPEESFLGETRTDRARRAVASPPAWAFDRCRDCPSCRPPHPEPIACACTRCSPWGNPTGASEHRTHFCGQVSAGEPLSDEARRWRENHGSTGQE